jgi:transposase
VVERALAWLNRCRRLTKDWENKTRNALAFLQLYLLIPRVCPRVASRVGCRLT